MIPELFPARRMPGLALLIPACFLLLGGCHGGAPHVPADWTGETCLLPDSTRPTLQVILTYGPVLPNHAALRLNGAPADVLFWDPGGGYGEHEEPPPPRRNDLILQNPPSLKTYLDYRFDICADAVVEIFEWPLSESRLKELRKILIEGLPAGSPQGSFRSQSFGLGCCLAVSDFLKRFTPDEVKVSQVYFLPQSLSHELYQGHPDRVILIRKDRSVLCVRPPDRKSK